LTPLPSHRALLFGALHLLNQNADWYAGLAIVIEAGIFLAAAYVWSRNLWFVIGAHFAWNFTESGIFGVAISGNQNDGLLRARMSGPAFLSGGAFGAETSVIAIALLILAKRKGRFVKPSWKKSSPVGAIWATARLAAGAPLPSQDRSNSLVRSGLGIYGCKTARQQGFQGACCRQKKGDLAQKEILTLRHNYENYGNHELSQPTAYEHGTTISPRTARRFDPKRADRLRTVCAEGTGDTERDSMVPDHFGTKNEDQVVLTSSSSH
jgi:Type II CAAX prenyl endopeptidase Rce1-like